MWVGAALMLGIMYMIVRWSNKLKSDSDEKEIEQAISEDSNLNA
jgi:hypothetical protein